MSEKIVRRPFHETIVQAIRLVSCPDEMDTISFLIHETKIPQNHDKIIEAWKMKVRALASIAIDESDTIQVLEEQRREAEAEAKEMAQRDEAMLREQVRREERLMREDVFEH